MIRVGCNQSNVANCFQLSESVVSRLVHLYRETENATQRSRSGSTRSTTHTQDRFLTVSIHLESLWVLVESCNIGLWSHLEFWFRLKQFVEDIEDINLHFRQFLRKIPLTQNHMRLWLKWHVNWNWNNQWYIKGLPIVGVFSGAQKS